MVSVNHILDYIDSYPNINNKLLVIFGPSASSKTDIGLSLAKKYGRYIISADSRQIYKHLDYSTGKTKKGYLFKYKKNNCYWVIDGVKYWGYDILEPSRVYSAGEFAYFVKDLVSKSTSLPIIVGGTGLYLQAIFGFLNLNTKSFSLSKRRILESKSVNELKELLRSKGFDLSSLNNSDLKNKRRLIRKLEILEFNLAKNPSKKFSLEDFFGTEALWIRVERKDYSEVVDSWITENFDFIMKEITWLKNTYPNSPLFDGFIFKEFRDFINGFIDKNFLEMQVKTSYLRYIKRQKTFFNKYFPFAKKFTLI